MSKVIFLDVDGVLADFFGSAAVACGRAREEGHQAGRWNGFEDWGLDEVQFWSKIDAQGEKFWSDMRILPWAMEVYNICLRTADQVVLLTSPPRAAWAWSGRVQWIQKHFGGPAFREFSLTPSGLKHLLAGPDRLLVDDNNSNVSQFIAAGGAALCFPQPWNSGRDILLSRMTFIQRNIQLWGRT
jgi:hypothetical protein